MLEQDRPYLTPEQTAEQWWIGQGRTVPDRITQNKEWEKMFQRYVLYHWYPNLREKKLRVYKEGMGDAS